MADCPASTHKRPIGGLGRILQQKVDDRLLNQPRATLRRYPQPGDSATGDETHQREGSHVTLRDRKSASAAIETREL